ncbi:hypothetical protein PENANT_c029G02416 [Penicillium antarcticum]|uniref:Uncharacterized protein n=1 Tax=Penicillium antarcticum TaxID=416450 RepID=A0A1V6PWS8_9EURO|nr:hypothetical protein PENANT_c029G02416 [Penicillium antarcticum]
MASRDPRRGSFYQEFEDTELITTSGKPKASTSATSDSSKGKSKVKETLS